MCLFAVGTIPANTGRMDGHDTQSIYTWGPSPRIRGESSMPRLHNRTDGTIPANTGRITSSVIFGISDTDHPREYGENATYTYGKFEVKGPSPRIRGEFAAVVLPFICLRTIPANTGRICFQAASSNSGRDHPREYGENRGKE